MAMSLSTYERRASLERIKQEAQSVEHFLKTVKETPLREPNQTGQQGRLIFAMDATASREPSYALYLLYEFQPYYVQQIPRFALDF